ncbi:type IV pilin protein [Desulfosediminicola flagellatus]|uniref:type IV pilin protein n=1 Tax=Desulfosediminicola flagellatus TaxID=2569541 RepID=UPI0010AC0601|nr:prepilin-type N-terminal cleavage/methylation domain-containing protein [Desulfosediminicola flagellatus]
MLKLMTKQMKKSNEKGFTLIELMIVVAIIGILAAIAIPQYQNFTKKSKASEAKVYLSAITTAEAAYYAENSEFATLAELGNPETGAEYFTYTVVPTNTAAVVAADGSVTSAAVYTVTTTATPNSKGQDAGLVTPWTMTYNGLTGVKTQVFAPLGY